MFATWVIGLLTLTSSRVKNPDPNLYRYVENSPVSHADTNGKVSPSITFFPEKDMIKDGILDELANSRAICELFNAIMPDILDPNKLNDGDGCYLNCYNVLKSCFKDLGISLQVGGLWGGTKGLLVKVSSITTSRLVRGTIAWIYLAQCLGRFTGCTSGCDEVCAEPPSTTPMDVSCTHFP